MKILYHKHVFLTSLLLTVAIFGTGIMLSYLIDFARIGEISKVIETHELDNNGYLLQQEFLNQFGGSQCETIQGRLTSLKEEVRMVGIDLSNYGRKGFFKKKDYDYLKRKYFLLELQFLSLVNDVNNECGQTYIPIVFFYKIDDNPSERQGFVLDEINNAYRSQVAVMSIDKDYTDEPLVNLLVLHYNVTKAPTLIIDNTVRFDRLVYTGELNATIINILRRPDEYGQHQDFDYVIRATGINKTWLIDSYKNLLLSNISAFAKGDILLALGRLLNNNSLICESLKFYDSYKPESREEQAIVYETYAAVGCGRNRRAFLLEASIIWRELGNNIRSQIEEDLAHKRVPQLRFGDYNYTANIKTPAHFATITFGNSSFTITKSDTLVSQVDRVNRDWLSGQLNETPFSTKLLTTFSERTYLPNEQLLPTIGWHEGGRIKEIEKIGLKRYLAAGTLVVKQNSSWYAPNEKGTFMFEVPMDKLLYPTTRFLSDKVAVIVDTHGTNMVVEQALRYNASVVVGCCDSESKVAASLYLADHRIKVLCFTDKYLPLLLGKNASILGSPPIQRNGNMIIAGAQPIVVKKDQIIVVEDVAEQSSLPKNYNYYGTPARYFKSLESSVSLRINYFMISKENQTYGLVDFADKLNATVIAARVYSYDDYSALKAWLDNSKKHKAILFHSSSYPYGLKLLLEYRNQTTFDDISPVFK